MVVMADPLGCVICSVMFKPSPFYFTGMSTEDAMTAYITMAKEVINKYGMWFILITGIDLHVSPKIVEVILAQLD